MPKDKYEQSPAGSDDELSIHDIIRALKDDDFRNKLNPTQLKSIPDDPAGFVRLLDSQFNIDAEAEAASLSFFTGTCGRVCQTLTPEFSCSYVPACW